MAKSISYGLTVSLTEADSNAITTQVSAGATAADKLSITAGQLLRDLARGGQMIPPEWASRIDAAIHTTDPGAVTEAVEKSAGRAGEATRVEWLVDPTQIAFYQMLADNAGVSLNHQLKTLLDFAYAQGWFGMSAPDPFKLLVSPEQWRYLQQVFEKDIVTGDDVVEKLRKVIGSPAIVSEDDDDLVMESLKG